MDGDEIRKIEVECRMAKAVSQTQQEAWTTWEDMAEWNITCSKLRSQEPLRIIILLKSVYDLLLN